jgi:energy-coupling factor transporter ATP-binding protein EcfA2
LKQAFGMPLAEPRPATVEELQQTMVSKVVTCRLPENLIQEIRSRAEATGRNRTEVVVEALKQAFGMPLAEPRPATVEELQQQFNQLEKEKISTELTQRLGAVYQEVLSASQISQVSPVLKPVMSEGVLPGKPIGERKVTITSESSLLSETSNFELTKQQHGGDLPEGKQDAISFPSLSSLRSAHSELLRHHRESSSTPELLTEIEEFIYRGRATGALLDTDEDRWASQSLLDYWSAILYRAGREPPDATLAEFDPTLAPELDDARCPYLGLEAFREEKSNLFYGRQRLLEKLVNHLKENRLLAVVGSSGSGKSSVVLGGLLPSLKVGALPGSENWQYYSPMVSGVNPLENLARLTQPRDVNATEWLQQQVESFQKNPNHLTKLSNEFGNRPCVLVVDQFEEAFTLCRDDSVRQAFINNLIGLIQLPGLRHTVILTMRTDFESQVARVPVLKDLFEQAQVRVTALDASELREAIEKPAELVGLKFEEGLVEALLQDVLGEPAALPLLQFTLLKLWDNRERNRVTWETYKRLGGGRQALARSADAFYEQLIPEEQVTVKRILLRMVRPTEGLEVTSNRIQRKTLYQAGEARDRVDRVLDKLIQARLIRLTEGDTPDDAQVEVAHEALVRNWPRLVEWLEDERVNLRRRWRLAVAAEDWQARGRDKSALLRGSVLAEAQRYEDLNALEVEFIQRSVEEEEVESIQHYAEESKEALYEQASAEAYRRLQRVIQEIDAKLQELSASQQNHLIETSTQIGMQEQLDALTQIQLELEQGREVADWLEQHIDSLTQMIGQEALNAYPKIRDAATAKQIRIFYLSITQFIERLIHCLKWGRNDILETPEMPVVLEKKLYEVAFEKLKTIQPEQLPKEGIKQLENYINYLLESLSTYQHLSLD